MKKPSPTLLLTLSFYGSNNKKPAWSTISSNDIIPHEPILSQCLFYPIKTLEICVYCFLRFSGGKKIGALAQNSTAQKMKFSIKDFFNKCDQISSFLRIWSHLLKKSLMELFIFCAVRVKLINLSTQTLAGNCYSSALKQFLVPH